MRDCFSGLLLKSSPTTWRSPPIYEPDCNMLTEESFESLAGNDAIIRSSGALKSLQPKGPNKSFHYRFAISKGVIFVATISKSPTTRTSKAEAEEKYGRICFVPSGDQSLVAVTVVFIGCATLGGVSRTLSTSSVLPDNSPIFNHLKSRNISMVQQILSTGAVRPNDKDQAGSSLLYVRNTAYTCRDCTNILLVRSFCQLRSRYVLAVAATWS